MSYENDWNSQSSADATYTFTIDSIAKSVVISTDYPETDFVTYISLIGPDGKLIAYNNISGSKKSIITKELCAGEYTVVVEGFNNSHGLFKLGISISDIVLSPETITTTLQSACEKTPIPDITCENDETPINGIETEGSQSKLNSILKKAA